jgi:hypothetical protein
MKTLTSLLLCCLTLLGLSQDSRSLILANPLPQGRVVANGNSFAVLSPNGMQDVVFYGVNANFDALNWESPEKFVDRLWLDGVNLIRLHHENASIDRQYAIALAAAKRGMYVAWDVCDDAFLSTKLQVYEKDPAVRTRALQRMDRMKPLFNLPNIAYLACVNEGANLLKGKYNGNRPKLVELANETYVWFKTELAKRGYTGLLGDLADGSIDVELFAPIVANQDIILMHAYGTHNQGKRWRDENWAENGHFLGTNIFHMLKSRVKETKNAEGQVIKTEAAPKPALMQEMACMFPNPQRAINELGWYSELKKWNISVVAFCYAANLSQMRGTHTEVDDFSLVTDPARYAAFRGGALIYKFGAGDIYSSYWGHLLKPSKRDPNYRCKWQKVDVNLTRERGSVVVRISATKALVVLVDQVLHRGQTNKDVGDGWKEIVSRGGLVFGYWDTPAVNIGAPVSGAYRLNTGTMAIEPTLVKSGNTFQPGVGFGVFEINTRTAIPLPEPPTPNESPPGEMINIQEWIRLKRKVA